MKNLGVNDSNKTDITEYSENELRLLVFNDEYLYGMRHRRGFLDTIAEKYTYTELQLDVLKENLRSDHIDIFGE
jgi:hypothetical protein